MAKAESISEEITAKNDNMVTVYNKAVPIAIESSDAVDVLSDYQHLNDRVEVEEQLKPQIGGYKKEDEIKAKLQIAQLEVSKNIENIMQRSENLQDMETRAGDLKEAAEVFKENAVQTKKTLRWLSFRSKVICLSFLFAIIAFIIVALMLSSKFLK